MKREIYLASLNVGQCFKRVPKDDEAETKDAETGTAEDRKSKVQFRQDIMKPEYVWKVLSHDGENVSAQNALGDTQAFPSNSLVVEIPRLGYDRMVERV